MIHLVRNIVIKYNYFKSERFILEKEKKKKGIATMYSR